MTTDLAYLPYSSSSNIHGGFGLLYDKIKQFFKHV